MTKTTYTATAPDGSQHTRKTDRTYTHAVLLEDNGPDGPVWGIAGFCGRLDLAQKKQTEHPGSIVVDVQVLGASTADTHEPEVTEDAEPTEDEAVEAVEASYLRRDCRTGEGTVPRRQDDSPLRGVGCGGSTQEGGSSAISP